MMGMGIMAGICISPYPSPYPTEKVGDSPYPVNAGIPHQNGDGLRQYSRGRVYLLSLILAQCFPIWSWSLQLKKDLMKRNNGILWD